MEQRPFGRDYAKYYDALYADKNYQRESSAVELLLRKYSPGASTLLELGCGTGNYTKLLASSFKVTAVERSAPMLEIARRKTKVARVNLVLGDVTKVLPRIKGKFDTCVGLFHVVNYIRTKRELCSLLRDVHSHLESGGLLILDSWNGTAVIRERPSVRIKKVALGRKTIVRIAEPRLRTSSSSCDIMYRIFVMRNGRQVSAFQENHRIRYYFPAEIRAVLRKAGFEPLQITRNGKDALRKDDWSMLVLARRN